MHGIMNNNAITFLIELKNYILKYFQEVAKNQNVAAELAIQVGFVVEL